VSGSFGNHDFEKVFPMVTLEQVSKRIFSDPSWFVKILIGGILMCLPVINLAVLGYFYRMTQMGKKGESFHLTGWDDWKALFVDGLRFFVIFFGLGFLPLLVGFLLSKLLFWIPSPLSYLPVIPFLILSGPMVGAGLYLYQRQESFQDSFQLPILIRMIDAAKYQLMLPTLAFLGFLFVGFPLLPFASFIGGSLIFYFYATVFRDLETAAQRTSQE
jgi:uncharacterized membrane protein YesL